MCTARTRSWLSRRGTIIGAIDRGGCQSASVKERCPVRRDAFDPTPSNCFEVASLITYTFGWSDNVVRLHVRLCQAMICRSSTGEEMKAFIFWTARRWKMKRGAPAEDPRRDPAAASCKVRDAALKNTHLSKNIVSVTYSRKKPRTRNFVRYLSIVSPKQAVKIAIARQNRDLPSHPDARQM